MILRDTIVSLAGYICQKRNYFKTCNNGKLETEALGWEMNFVLYSRYHLRTFLHCLLVIVSNDQEKAQSEISTSITEVGKTKLTIRHLYF